MKVHDYAISLAFGARPDRMVLVTDAMAAQGLPIGKHKLGNMVVDVSHDRAVLEGTDTLAGSIISLDQCVQRVVLKCGISKVQVSVGIAVRYSICFLLTFEEYNFA